MSQIRGQQRSATAVTLLLLLCPLFAYFVLLSISVVDVPYWDDYDSILGFALKYETAPGFSEQVALVLSQHNEHRPAILRLAALLSLSVVGAVDFELLVWLGNLLLVGLFLAILALRKPQPGSRRWMYALPLALLLFQPQFYDTLLWPTVLFANFAVLLFATLTFLALSWGTGWGMIVAFVAAALATYSQGNGFLVLPLGALVLWYSAGPGARRGRTVLIWSLLSLALILLYFSGFTRPQDAAQPPLALHSIKEIVLYALGFIGAAPGFAQRHCALLFGCAPLAVCGWLFGRRYFRHNPALFGLLGFLLLTAAANTLGRYAQGFEYALAQPRYKLVSILLFAVSYLCLLEALNGQRQRRICALVAASLSLIFCALSYLRYTSTVLGISRTLSEGMVECQVRGTGLYYPVHPHAATILGETIQRSLYRPPQDLIDSYQTVPVSQQLPSPTGEISYSIDTIIEGTSSWLVTGWVMPQGLLQTFESPQLVMHSAQETLFFPVRPVARIDVVRHFGALRAARSGFALLIQKQSLQSREYHLGIFDPVADTPRFVMTEKVLRLGAKH